MTVTPVPPIPTPSPGEQAPDIQTYCPLHVLDLNGVPSNLIIRTTDDFQLAMEFEFISQNTQDLAGTLTYDIKYFAESIGPGPEYNLGNVAKKTVDNQYKYNETTPPGAETALLVKAGTMEPGVYRVAAMISFKLDCPPGQPRPFRMTAYCEGPAIELYTP
jgi:hypothetical protein